MYLYGSNMIALPSVNFLLFHLILLDVMCKFIMDQVILSM